MKKALGLTIVLAVLTLGVFGEENVANMTPQSAIGSYAFEADGAVLDATALTSVRGGRPAFDAFDVDRWDSRLVTQKDLMEYGVPGAGSACLALAIMSGYEKASGRCLGLEGSASFVLQEQASGVLDADCTVAHDAPFVGDAATICGFARGWIDRGSGLNRIATIRDETSYNGSPHHNFGDSSGEFSWESYNGETDRLDPSKGITLRNLYAR